MSNVSHSVPGRSGATTSRPQEPSEGIGPLLGDLLRDLQALVRGEMALARAEIREDLTQAGRGVASLAIAAIVGLTGFIFLMLGATYVLNLWMRMWLAAAIVGVVLVAVGGALAMSAKKSLSAQSLKPDRTIDSMKEDQEWAKRQINSVTR
jgi:hypothetical protein